MGTVVLDQRRIRQVVFNLLSNAIRYNRPGGKVNLVLSSDDRDAQLEVRDTGVGILPEDAPHIFERFYRVDAARSRADGGSGLGLAICKTIIEAHGGNISFASSQDGTAFTVRLCRK